LFKKSTIYNEYFPTFADFKAAANGLFARLDDYRKEIQSLITDSSISWASSIRKCPEQAGGSPSPPSRECRPTVGAND